MTQEHEQSRIEDLTHSLLEIAVESWRFTRVFERLLSKLDAGEQGRYLSQYRWFQRRLEESLLKAELRLVNVEGQSFDPGMAAAALNINEFGPQDTLVVEQMLEPIIMGPDGLLKTGTVILKKV